MYSQEQGEKKGTNEGNWGGKFQNSKKEKKNNE